MTKDNYDAILWLQEWYYSNCDGDWEHDQNILITTIDNPGWAITIKLDGTNLENKHFPKKIIENSEFDWYCCRIENTQFLGDGGPYNLMDMIKVFKDWVEM